MPVTIFCCYAHEDERYLNKLKTHLRPLQQAGLIDVWHDRDINAGTDWEQQIKDQLNTAQIILLLVSPDFMDSDYCYGIEMQRALERGQRGEARVIPIILRPARWKDVLGTFQALPKDGRPVTDPYWRNQNKAFLNVAEGIRKVIEQDTPSQKSKEQWLEEGKKYLDLNQFSVALVAYEQAIRLDPNYVYAYSGKGYALKELKRFEEALTAYEQAIRLDPNNTEGYNGKGMVLFELRRYVESLDSYNLAINLDPNNALSYYRKGMVLASLMRFDEALNNFDLALSINPEDTHAWAQKGLMLVYLWRYEEAIASFDQAIAHNPKDAISYNYRGNTFATLKKNQEAITDYEQALLLMREAGDRAGEASTLNNMGGVYHMMGQPQQALDLYEQALLINREIGDRAGEASTLNNIGQVYDSLGQKLKSLECYQQALISFREIGDRGSEAITLNNLGRMYISLGQKEETLKYYQEALDISVSMGDQLTASKTFCDRGNVYIDLEEYQQAIEDLNRALELNPRLTQAYVYRGIANGHIQDYQRAIEDLNLALELDPSLSEVYSIRGQIYASSQQYERAIEDYNRAIELNPQLVDVYNNRGNVYLALMNYEQALINYDNALELNSQSVEAYYGRGSVYANLKEYQRAIEDFTHAIELDPNNAMFYYSRGIAYTDLLEYQSAIWDYNHAIELNHQLADAYSALSRALIYTEQWAEAERVIGTIENSYSCASALSELGVALAQAQQKEQAQAVWAEAERVIRSIADSYSQTSALRGLEAALAQAQQWAEAERVIGTIENSHSRAEALSELGTALAQAQEWTEAERVIGTIEEPYAQAQSLNALAAALTQVQQLERARVIWTEAERVAQTIEDSETRDEILRLLNRQLNEETKVQHLQEPSIKYDIVLAAPMEPVSIGEHFEVVVYLNNAGNIEYIDSSKYLLDISRDEVMGSELSLFLIAPPGFKLEGENVASLPLDLFVVEESTTVPSVPHIARFNMIALRPGPAMIAVELYRGPIFETTLKTEMQVAKINEDEQQKVSVTARPRPVLQPDLILEVQMDWIENDNAFALRYTLSSLRASLPIAHIDDYHSELLPAGWIERIRGLLGSLLEDMNGSQSEDMRSRLISLGQYLFQLLFPLNLQSEIRNLAFFGNMFTLLILADQDSWIPWELLYDGQAFLGERFIIGRWPRELDDTRPYEFPVGAVNIAYYASIKQPEQWVDLLELPGVPHPQILPGGVFSSIDTAEEMRGLYLVRSGQVTGLSSQYDAPVQLNGTGETGNVEHEVRSSKLSLRRNRPLVNLGFVSAGQSELTLLEQAWAPTFVRAGCSAFVGPLWAVQPAVEEAFVSAFYSYLWAGHSLGDAFSLGRILARETASDSLDWMAYVLFGDPMARPYRPVEGQGYAVVEPIGREINDPLLPEVPARFRVSLRRTPPVWHEERVIEVASTLTFNNLQVHVMTFGLQVRPTLPIVMTRTPTDDYLGWFSLIASPDMAGDEELVQVYFVDGRETIHALSFSLKIAASGGRS